MAQRPRSDGPSLELTYAPITELEGFEPEEDSPEAVRVQADLKRLVDEAIDFYEDELEPDQTTATDYYYGRPFGDEQQGRSKVVNTVVRDAVLAMVPSLMRIVYEADRVAEYEPRMPEDEPGAKQATDYARYVITEDNAGFRIFWDWIMDALVRRLGIVKWWWEDVQRKERAEFTGLTEQEVNVLASDPEVTIVSGTTREENGMTVYDVAAFHVERDGVVRIACVPNEEWFYTPYSRSLEDATIIAHVREMRSAEVYALLVADGMEEDDANDLIERTKGGRRRPAADDLEAARQFNEGSSRFVRGKIDGADDVVMYAEVYGLIPVEEEGYEDDVPRPTERRLFKCVGPEFEITNGKGLGECTDDIPFAVWTPIPEPHTIVGLSVADLLKDVQRIISQIERGTLDSLAQAITPTTEVVYGQVNMQDFVNPEVAGLRRVRQIGMTREVVHHFVGGETLPMLNYYGSVIEDRTGKNKGAMGLDADALQSTTKIAAAQILSASQQRIEIVARVFAETGLRPLFRGLLKLITKHQQPGRIVRLRNEYTPIDPRAWDATMDVKINVALGAGTPADRIEVLGGLATKQQELMMQGSPLVSNVELRHTLGKMTELAGNKDTDQFFKKWGEQEEMALQQQKAQQPPPPDPNMMLVEIEKMKAQSSMEAEQQKLSLEHWKAVQQNDRERDKQASDAALKERELELKYQAEIDDSKLRADVQRERVHLEADVKREAMKAMEKPRTLRLERGQGAGV